MKRKDYRKPTMQVVQLHQTQMLMTSGVGASRSNYGTADEQTWGDGASVKSHGNYVDWDNN